MEWEFIIKLILAILGTALVAGGIVAYRRSENTGVKSLSAAAISAGVVMWAVILITTQVTSEAGGPGVTLTPSIEVQGISVDGTP
ncbi:hypothetical protein ACFLXV_00120 [Chloroflexota bacterium]